MKKLFLIAALGVAGIVSANDSVAKKEKQTKVESKSTKVVKTISKGNKKPRTIVVYTSCGLAVTTTQDWTDQQFQDYAILVNHFNCK